MHAALVRAIERLHADRLDEHVEQLAHHARRGELRDEAVRSLHQAGARAAARSAHREAIALFEQALGVLGELPETPDTLAAIVDVRIAHASALIATKGVASSEVEAAVLHTHELASRLGDAGRLFPALWRLWLMTNGRGRYREALELAERLRAVAEPDGDRGRLLEAHHSLWTTMGAMGEAVAAIRNYSLYPTPARGVRSWEAGQDLSWRASAAV